LDSLQEYFDVSSDEVKERLKAAANATQGGLGSIPVETGHVGSILDRDDGNIVLVRQRELQ
jgi:hypothetical protein